MFNRLANTKNQYQGTWRKVLCVCSAGLLRSPTIAWVLSNELYNCNTRAAGIVKEYALIHVDAVLVEWADEIICACGDHVDAIRKLVSESSDATKPVHCLTIPDEYRMRDPALVRAIKSELQRIQFDEDSVPNGNEKV